MLTGIMSRPFYVLRSSSTVLAFADSCVAWMRAESAAPAVSEAPTSSPCQQCREIGSARSFVMAASVSTPNSRKFFARNMPCRHPENSCPSSFRLRFPIGLRFPILDEARDRRPNIRHRDEPERAARRGPVFREFQSEACLPFRRGRAYHRPPKARNRRIACRSRKAFMEAAVALREVKGLRIDDMIGETGPSVIRNIRRQRSPGLAAEGFESRSAAAFNVFSSEAEPPRFRGKYPPSRRRLEIANRRDRGHAHYPP